MGNRLSKIYTRTGDKGTTGLGDGSRVEKDNLRVEAYGTVDELNSFIGLLLTESMPEQLREWLTDVQHDLFDLGSEMCVPGFEVITPAMIEQLEQQIETMNEDLPYLKEFILPGGSRAASLCHVARTVCRRGERRTSTLMKQDDSVRSECLQYLNRLSDWLFVAARTLARADGGEEVLWDKNRRQSVKS